MGKKKIELPEGTPVLDVRDPNFATKLMEAAGVKPGEQVTIMTPRFDHPPGAVARAAPPADRAAFDALKTMSVTALREMGLRVWGKEEDADYNELPNGRTLWLFPHEWYSAIPDGYPILDIWFNEEVFKSGETDDDMRFGCLAFGFAGPALPKKPEAAQ